MTELVPTPDEIAALLQVEHLLDQRWPETKLEPSTARISALMEMLGSPQRGYPSIHIAGTNGKTSVARMVDVADYIAFIRLEHFACISDLVDSAAELFFLPRTFRLGNGGQAHVDWSAVPRIELDFVLVSKEIEVTNFQVPDVRFSDHRPILCDFNVRGAVASQTAVA